MGFEVVIQRVLGGRVENPAGNLHLNVYPFRFPWQGLLRNCGELVAWFSGIPDVVPDEVQEFLFQTFRLAGECADVLFLRDGAVEGGQGLSRLAPFQRSGAFFDESGYGFGSGGDFRLDLFDFFVDAGAADFVLEGLGERLFLIGRKRV